MSTSEWTVRLLLEQEEARALSRMEAFDALRVFREIGSISLNDDPDDETRAGISVDVEAASWQQARMLVQHMVGVASEAVGLRPRELPVVWVAPVGEQAVGSTYHLDHARELLREERPEMAVVAAHLQLDALVNVLKLRAAADDGSRLAELVARDRSTSLTHDSGRKRLEALIGIRVTDAPGWKAFDAGIGMRNNVVHGGLGIPLELAEESDAVVASMWRWLLQQSAPGASTLGAPRLARPMRTGEQLVLWDRREEGAEGSSRRRRADRSP